MTKRTKLRNGFAALALATMVGSTGCGDTELQGVIIDDDLLDPDLMLPMARGVNSELTDNFRGFFSGVQYLMGAPSDDFTNDGVSNDEERVSAGDLRYRDFADFNWEQLHEAAWAGYKGVQTIEESLGTAAVATSPITAQLWFTSGIAERFLGEMFCEQVYGYGHDGGPLLAGDADQFDASHTVPRDSAFRRSLFAFQQALAVAEAAVAAGEQTPGNDPIFDPQNLVYKSHAGIAQAASNLGDWTLAVQHAAQVPDDFVANEHHDVQAEENSMYDTFWDNDDLTLWNSPVVNQFDGDPRAPWTRCGEFDTGPRTTPGTRSEISSEGCTHPSREFRAESNTIPMYRSDKYTSGDDDVALVKGAEMRLIEAEAALQNGDLVEFKAQVDRARAVYELDPIPLPTSAGALEYPNAEDDAWSILDRERLLTLHLEGRRLWDLDRWNHPFLTEKHVLTTRLYDDYGADLPRMSCYPVAEIECRANPNLVCPPLI